MITFSRRSLLATTGAISLAGVLAACADTGTDGKADAEYNKAINSGPVAAADVVAASSWATAVKKAGKLVTGGTKTSEVFSWEDSKTKKISGFDAAIAQVLARYIIGGTNDARTLLDITQVTSDTREVVLGNGSVQAVIATYTITPERAKKIDFAGPYYSSGQAVLVRADESKITGVSDLAGVKVAVQSGSSSIKALQEAAPKAEQTPFNDHNTCLSALETKQVDAYVVDESLLLSAMQGSDAFKIVGEPFTQDPYGIGLPQGSDAKAFVDSVLTPLLSDSLTVTAAGTSVEKTAASRQVVLSPDQIADLTVISTEGGELSAVLDSQRLHDTIIDAMGAIETAPTNAGWTIDGSAEGAAGAKPQYVAPSPGEGIDTDALNQQLVDAGTTGTTSDGRTVALTMITTQPEITTPEKDWGITEVTGEFSTPFSSEPGRDQNLIRGAEQMNGQIVMPGETFSVEQALGPVDYEHGFTDAGVISNGQHVDALGGGLSQIGTTMFNVGFEAGMDDIEHHPHSYYFDRYPAGREATLWTGQKDVKFANSTPYAALIQAWVADGEVHTRIWSTHYYDVSITSSERYNYRPVQTITRPAGAGCQAYSGGNPGFDITVTRTRTAPDKAVPDDVLTTTYDADNNIACGGPKKSR